MTVQEINSKIAHKTAQLIKAEMRVAEEPTTHNFNNYEMTKQALHALALQLAEATK